MSATAHELYKRALNNLFIGAPATPRNAPFREHACVAQTVLGARLEAGEQA